MATKCENRRRARQPGVRREGPHHRSRRSSARRNGRRRQTESRELKMSTAPQSNGLAIHAEHLVRRFGQFTAVNDVSFQVQRGEIFGFLGPNAIAKTTVSKMLTGLLPLPP